VLTWTREQDGTHYGRPVYEYRAVSEGRTYSIVWASDRGGTFGYTATRKDASDRTEYLTQRHGIHWARRLKHCKSQCEVIEKRHASVG
jgi:hypothetical protein